MPQGRRQIDVIDEATHGLEPRSGVCASGLARAKLLSSLWTAFQPIVDASKCRVVAYEALMRGHDPGLSTPLAILRDAEQGNYLHDVGRRIRDLAATAFAKAPIGATLFVNLHPRDVLDPTLYDPHSALASIANRVVFELTERAALDDIEDLAAHVSQLRSRGYRIAVDDLGSGYSGLSSVVALEPDFVKLDMSLVRDVHTSRIRQRLIKSLASVCHDMRMQLIAEGVESREECQALRQLGCDLLQGYFFARPAAGFAV